jgi:hypothetical protein
VSIFHKERDVVQDVTADTPVTVYTYGKTGELYFELPDGTRVPFVVPEGLSERDAFKANLRSMFELVHVFENQADLRFPKACLYLSEEDIKNIKSMKGIKAVYEYNGASTAYDKTKGQYYYITGDSTAMSLLVNQLADMLEEELTKEVREEITLSKDKEEELRKLVEAKLMEDPGMRAVYSAIKGGGYV